MVEMQQSLEGLTPKVTQMTVQQVVKDRFTSPRHGERIIDHLVPP